MKYSDYKLQRARDFQDKFEKLGYKGLATIWRHRALKAYEFKKKENISTFNSFKEEMMKIKNSWDYSSFYGNNFDLANWFDIKNGGSMKLYRSMKEYIEQNFTSIDAFEKMWDIFNMSNISEDAAMERFYESGLDKQINDEFNQRDNYTDYLNNLKNNKDNFVDLSKARSYNIGSRLGKITPLKVRSKIITKRK